MQIFAPVGLFLDDSANLYFADHLYMLVEQMESNYAVLDFTQTPVQVGNQSAPQTQTVENDGNAPLNLTAPGIFVDTNDPAGVNAALDAATTTCPMSNPFLADEADCVIGAVYAPSLSLPFGVGVSSESLDANIDIGKSGDTLNSPLDIELVGIATPVNATQLALTSIPNPSNFGAAVTFTATVTSGATAGTPVGTVTFTDTFNKITTTLGAPVALSGGMAAYTTATPLAVGSHLITASFTSATTSNFLPSTGTLTQVVGEATATTLKPSQNPSAVGLSVTFTATVSVASGGGVPLDGTVTFTDTPTGGTAAPLGTPQTIGVSGIATVSTATLTSGLHTITATYSGDAANGIIGSKGTFNQDVQAQATVTLASSNLSSVYGEPITFTVTVPTIGTIAATGTASILGTGLTPTPTVTLTGNPGAGQFTTSALAVNTYALTASYPGDNYYSQATSTPTTNQVVTAAQTNTTLSSFPTTGIAGAPVAITATVALTQGAATLTGTVSFTDSLNGGPAGPLGAATQLVGGKATINPILAAGSHSIIATYSGDPNDSPSVSAAYPLTVNLAATTTIVTAAPNPALVLATVTFTAKVTSIGGGIPQGTVTFSAGGTPIGAPVTLDPTGTATITSSTLAAGTYAITAVYSGDANDQRSNGAAANSLVVGTIPTVTDLGASSTGGTTPQVILVAAVLNNASGASGSLPVPGGTVNFLNGATIVGSAPLDSSGVATFVPSLPTGTYNIVASYLGDTDHAPSQSAPVSISTTATDFNLTVTPDKVTLAATQNVSVNVSLNSTDGFADTIGLGCASLPAGVNCHFSTPSVALLANGVENVTLTIDTNNPLGGGTSAMNLRPGSRGVSLAGFFLPLCLLFGCIFWRFRRRHAKSMTAALILLLAGAALSVSGCSGSFTQSSATPGTYVIQVTGTGVKSDISHYENVTLTITAK